MGAYECEWVNTMKFISRIFLASSTQNLPLATSFSLLSPSSFLLYYYIPSFFILSCKVNEAALLAVRDHCDAVTNAHFEAAIAKQMTYQCAAPSGPSHFSSSFNIEDMFFSHDNGLGSVD